MPHPTIPRWFQQNRARKLDHRNSNLSSNDNNNECYACTQFGIPVFHSTSCDEAHQPQWQASAGTSLAPIHSQSNLRPNMTRTQTTTQFFSSILDPRSKWVRKWNRVAWLARGVALAVDPLFLYALSLSIGKGGAPCLLINYTLAGVVSVLRTCLDIVHLFHLLLQFRLAYVSRESLIFGCGKLEWDARAIASHYLRSLKGFWLDLFVIIPVPQTIFWLVVPRLIDADKYQLALTLLLIMFLFQFLPKLYHTFCLMDRLREVTGYIFGSIWWGFGLNIIAYLIASHVTGGCWYLLATQRVVSCLQQQCEQNGNCSVSMWCSKAVCYQFMYPQDMFGNLCGGDNITFIDKPMCLDDEGTFPYGIYQQSLLVVTSNSLAVKILYPIFWGLLNLSSFGNELSPTTNVVEVLYSIFMTLCGLALFTLMVGNIQVFLAVLLSKNKRVQLRRRDVDWWMSRRQLPSSLRQRVVHYEDQRWALMGGENETEWIEELPEGLRRDIKRYLCLDLIKKVPLFHHMDDLILENICDRVKPLIFCKGEKILREGDPVSRMIFIMRGRIKRCQRLSKSKEAMSMLKPGGFLGDELLSWCLRSPFNDRLPASSATFTCVRSTEAFGLEADRLRYITEHFKYRFSDWRLKRTMRYYSSNWRTWAAVNIQFAWRRYKIRIRGAVIHPVMQNGSTENKIRLYAAMFMSIRPHDHLD